MLNKGDATTRTRSGLESLHRRSNAYVSASTRRLLLSTNGSSTTLDSRSNASNDVLYKARDMGKKIWTLEKFQRMLSTLFCHDGSDDDEQQSKRHVTSLLPSKREREADLSQLLRNERNNAPVDRKPWQEIISFRGVYVYVHDMDERTRPVMVREYQKPVRKEDGKWPMFRSVSKGRCPFVEELYPPPRDDDAEAKRRAAAAEQAKKVKPTRAAVKQKQAVLEQTIDPPVTRSATQSPKKEQQPLKELPDLANQMPKPQLPASLAKGDMPKLQRQASGSVGDMPPMLGSTNANYQGLSRKPGGEPLASGMRANITSAIQSQMYSSTAPSAPGQRVGMTRQQHQMSRRILERQSGLSNGNMPSSFSVTDVRAALNKDSAPATRRNTRLQTTDKLSKIHEDEDVSEETDAVDQARTEAKAVQPSRRRAPVKRDPKPGYCENCRDKYDDFYEVRLVLRNGLNGFTNNSCSTLPARSTEDLLHPQRISPTSTSCSKCSFVDSIPPLLYHHYTQRTFAPAAVTLCISRFPGPPSGRPKSTGAPPTPDTRHYT